MSPAVVIEERLRIPVETHTLAGFRAWALSDAFPETGRIDFLAGDVEVDVSPEDLHTHGTVKVAITAALHWLVADGDLGEVFVDRTRVSSPAADLSAEPDVVLILWPSLEQGRCRYLPATSGSSGRFVEVEGAPDLIVEVVSDSSVGKDTRRLPPLYARAGVPELWLVDARGEEPSLRLLSLVKGQYGQVAPEAEGWLASSVLRRSVRLQRRRTRFGTWRYLLETAPERT